MTTTNENTWNEDLNNQAQGGGSNSFGTPDAGDTTNRNYSDDIDENSGVDRDSLTEGGTDAGNIPGSYSSNESFSGANSAEEDDEDIETDGSIATGDDIDADDDELIDTDDDLEDDELDTDDESATTTGVYSDELGDSESGDLSDEDESDDDVDTGYDNQTDVERQQGGDEASWSEQTDVTPPNAHGFPDAAGSPKTDFVSRPHGRTTGRMLGHEPGTEGI